MMKFPSVAMVAIRNMTTLMKKRISLEGVLLVMISLSYNDMCASFDTLPMNLEVSTFYKLVRGQRKSLPGISSIKLTQRI